MNSSLISVVMPLYNNAKELSRSANSVLSQTFEQFELIIINDGSTDSGEKRAREISDRRVRVVDQDNRGVSAARNRGVTEANGEIVAFLDADDEWKPDFLETIDRLRRNFSNCSVFATHYLYKEIDGSVRTPILRGIPSNEWEGILPDYFDIAAHSDPPLWSSAVAVRKNVLLALGGFPEGVTVGEDLLTWARLAAVGPIAYSAKPRAIFWLRAPLIGYPTRVPELPDFVGSQLAKLATEQTGMRRVGILHYAAVWHRMRASMFINVGDASHAREEATTMIRYHRSNPQAYVYLLLAITPKIVRNVVLQIFTLVKAGRRRLSKR